MPLNLLKIYNTLLDLAALTDGLRKASLYGVFRRDIEDNPGFSFRGKKINPIKGKEPEMQTLFTHLTTVIANEKIRNRIFEYRRSERLHWIRYHVEERSPHKIMAFSVEDGDGIRTYIFDESENYVIVLAPYRDKTEYYLLTAYYLEGRNTEKIKKKYNRRLAELY